MNIIWLADFTAKGHQGGAQQTNKEMVDYGRKKGHKIEYMTPLEYSAKKLSKADLVILNNQTLFSPHQITWIIANKIYMRYEHDYDAVEAIKDFPSLYLLSRLNIFLSPQHLKETERILGKNVPNAKVIAPPVDSKKFKVTRKRRVKNSVFWCGNLVPQKGMNNVLRYLEKNPKKKLFVAGIMPQMRMVADKFLAAKNVKFLGEIKHSKIAEVYNRYESFIHLPNWKEPFGRATAEAYLCGCNLIVNDRSGALSFDWDWSDYEDIKEKVNTQSEFWETVRLAYIERR